MTARMRELLGLLALVVERVRASTARAETAEARAAQMSVMLDALSDENAVLRTELDQAEDALADARETVRSLRETVDLGERLAEALEARAAEAELRIHRAADALGLPAPAEAPVSGAETSRASAALH